jgi:hypothetical protein
MLYARGQRIKVLPDAEDLDDTEMTGKVLDNLGGGLYFIELDPPYTINGESSVEILDDWLKPEES